MLTQEQVIQSIGIAIEDPNFSIDSTIENTENWDSLGVLSLVSVLAKMTAGATDTIPEFLNVSSAVKLIEILKENNLLA